MGFDQLLNEYINTKYQLPQRRWICPRCGEVTYFLETERGLNCRFCGWNEAGGQKPPFIPRTPEGQNT